MDFWLNIGGFFFWIFCDCLSMFEEGIIWDHLSLDFLNFFVIIWSIEIIWIILIPCYFRTDAAASPQNAVPPLAVRRLSLDTQQAAESAPTPRRSGRCRLPEPGARHKPGSRGTSGIACRLLLPRNAGGALAAERAAEQFFLIIWPHCTLHSTHSCLYFESEPTPGSSCLWE